MSHINNPFASPASAIGNAESKYPDLSSELGQMQQQNQQMQQQQTQQQQPFQQQQMYHQPTGYQSPMQYQQTGYPSASSSSMFQQSPYSPAPPQPQQHHQQYSQQQYGQQYNQLQPQQWPKSNPLSDLDPYSNLDSLHSSSTSSGAAGAAAAAAAGGQVVQGSLQKESHPRAYVNQQKAQLMAWDTYAWKQLLNKLDALREAWESRKALLLEAGRKGADPSAVEQLKRQADDHIDTIHASKLQLSEVQSGWRHSTDAASKSRVREAINAGLSALPEYPTALDTATLGGTFVQKAKNEFVMSQFSQQYGAPQQQWGGQQQQQMMQQPMYTGYPQQQQHYPQNPYGPFY